MAETLQHSDLVDPTTARPVPIVMWRSGAAWLAVQTRYVEEVSVLGPLTAVPRAPAFVTGLMLVGSRAVPVVDLVRFLSLPAEAEDSDRTERLVVVAAGPLRAGVVSRQVHVIDDVRADQIHPVTSTTATTVERFATGEVEVRGAVVQLLDLPTLLEAMRARR